MILFHFRESAQGEIQSISFGIYFGISATVMEWRNSNGTLFHELYPQTTANLPGYLLMDVFGNVQYEIFRSFINVAFYVVMSDMDEEPSMGSFTGNYSFPDFEEEYLKAADKYLFSGQFKQSLAGAFADSGESPYADDTENFDNFIDEVYDDFEVWNGFRETFQDIYEGCQEVVWAKGVEIATTNDVIEITTQYMR